MRKYRLWWWVKGFWAWSFRLTFHHYIDAFKRLGLLETWFILSWAIRISVNFTRKKIPDSLKEGIPIILFSSALKDDWSHSWMRRRTRKWTVSVLCRSCEENDWRSVNIWVNCEIPPYFTCHRCIVSKYSLCVCYGYEFCHFVTVSTE